MKVAIAGAGKVGRSIARELIANNHEVLLLDKNAAKAKQGAVSGAAVPSPMPARSRPSMRQDYPAARLLWPRQATTR